MKVRSIIFIGILTLGLLGNAVADLNDGLVAYYPFDGNASDESGRGNDGVVSGATLTEDRFDNISNAYDFDGVDDYIELPGNLNLIGNDYTFSAWIEPKSYGSKSSGSSSCFASVLSYRWRAHQNGSSINSGASLFLYRSNDCTGGGRLSPSFIDSQFSYNGVSADFFSKEWFLYSVVRNNSTMTLYINGAEVSRSAVSTGSVHHNSSYPRTTIGANFAEVSGTFGPFQGKIDDLRIYNRALSESEIQDLYQEGTDTCTEYSNATVAPNLDIHLPSLNYLSLTESLNLWVDLEFYGQDGNIVLWKLKDFDENKGSAVGCETDTAVTVSPNLDIQILSIDYQLLSGTLNLRANFEYYGQGTQGELLWKLIDYEENK